MKHYNLTSSLLRSQTFLVLVLLLFYSCKTTKNNSRIDSQKQATIEQGKGFNKLSEKEQLTFKMFFFDANKEKILGNFEAATSLFLKALDVYPASAPAMYELANIFSYHKSYRNALFYSKSATILDSKNVWYQLLYIDCLRENKQYATLITEYKKLIKNNPKQIEYYYEFANVYLSLSMPTSAIEIYDDIEKRKGITDEISMQKVMIYKTLKKLDKSLLEIQKLINKFPTEGKYYGIEGELHQLKGDDEKAFKSYTKVLELNPDDPYAHLTMADYYRNQHDQLKTLEQIKIAFNSLQLDIDTKVKILLSYYAITEKNTEFKADAEELCKIVIDKHPKEAKSYSIYGDFLYRDKKLEEAKTQYKNALLLDKSKYAIWDQLLIIESEIDDYSSLLSDSKEVMELFPNQSLAYYLNGISNLHFKKLEEAISSLTKGIDFVFDNDLFLSQFYANIGDAQNQLKNYTESDAAFDKALEVTPGSSYILNNYAYYLSLRNANLDKAAEMSRRSNEMVPNNSSFQDTYSWILFKMKNYEDARVWIEKAISSGGGQSGILIEHYGDILYQLKDVENAVKSWINAKELGGTTDSIDKKIEDKSWHE